MLTQISRPSARRFHLISLNPQLALTGCAKFHTSPRMSFVFLRPRGFDLFEAPKKTNNIPGSRPPLLHPYACEGRCPYAARRRPRSCPCPRHHPRTSAFPSTLEWQYRAWWYARSVSTLTGRRRHRKILIWAITKVVIKKKYSGLKILPTIKIGARVIRCLSSVGQSRSSHPSSSIRT